LILFLHFREMSQLYQGQQIIGQLPKIRGSYFHLVLDAKIVEQWPLQRKTRLICTLEETVTFRCGLNHLGDGNFFIILNKANLKKAGRQLGDRIHFSLEQDPDPLGVKVPEVLTVLLEQDEILKEKYESLSMGKKRHVIHSIITIKNIDLQVAKAEKMINASYKPKRK